MQPPHRHRRGRVTFWRCAAAGAHLFSILSCCWQELLQMLPLPSLRCRHPALGEGASLQILVVAAHLASWISPVHSTGWAITHISQNLHWVMAIRRFCRPAIVQLLINCPDSNTTQHSTGVPLKGERGLLEKGKWRTHYKRIWEFVGTGRK